MRPLRLGMQLGLFQLSLGILGVLILGLLNRLLIQDIQLPAVLADLALLLMVCFLGPALMTRRLDVVGFRNTVKTRFSDVMDMAVD